MFKAFAKFYLTFFFLSDYLCQKFFSYIKMTKVLTNKKIEAKMYFKEIVLNRRFKQITSAF